MLDNGSRDGSAEAARAHPAVTETVALDQRRGKALNDSELLRRARGRLALLLNEDSELHAGGDARPLERPAGTPARRRARGRGWCAPTAPRRRRPGASRPRSPRSRARSSSTGWSPSRAAASGCGRSTGASRRRCSSGARRPPRSDYLDEDFFVYSDEVDFARRLRDAGWRSLYVPAAVAIHHEQLSTGSRSPSAGSSNSRATATSTCASTTRRPPPARCAG